jgi:hypothetical protein
MTIQCNAGTISTTSIGTLPNYGPVWYCNGGIANILSFANARNNGCDITYDHTNNTFSLQQTNGTLMKFIQSPGGLYYHDTQLGIALVNTVEENKSKYYQCDYLHAKEAHDLMDKIGRPSLQQLLTILDNNQLPNCPVTHCDAMIAEAIFGLDLGSTTTTATSASSTAFSTILASNPIVQSNLVHMSSRRVVLVTSTTITKDLMDHDN